jgi:hypothetical protein
LNRDRLKVWYDVGFEGGVRRRCVERHLGKPVPEKRRLEDVSKNSVPH